MKKGLVIVALVFAVMAIVRSCRPRPAYYGGCGYGGTADTIPLLWLVGISKLWVGILLRWASRYCSAEVYLEQAMAVVEGTEAVAINLDSVKGWVRLLSSYENMMALSSTVRYNNQKDLENGSADQIRTRIIDYPAG